MDLPEYVAVLRRRWAWVIGPLIIAVSAAWLWDWTNPRTYASTEALLYLSSPQNSTRPEAWLNSYVSLATSNHLVDQVRQDLRLKETTPQVTRRLTAETKPNSLILTVRATGSTPEAAHRLAAAAASRLASLSTTLNAVGGSAGSSARTATPASATGSPSGRLVTADAATPAVEVSGIPVTIGLGAVLGLLLGTVGALVREATDSRIRFPEQLHRLGIDEHMVVCLPDADRLRPRSPVSGLPAGRVPDGFHLLRAILLRCGQPQPTRIVVSSCRDVDRLHGVTAALAVTLCRASTKVVLVSAEIGTPWQSAPGWAFGEPGLAEVLTKQSDLASAIATGPECNLWLLPAGRIHPFPEDLLASTELVEVIAELEARFDLVLVGAPPLGASSGTLALVGGSGSGVILVVVRGRTRRTEGRQALRQLQAVGSSAITIALVSSTRRFSATLTGPGRPALPAPPDPMTSGLRSAPQPSARAADPT
jgi:capsular polysaccharide biosynthesis protein